MSGLPMEFSDGLKLMAVEKECVIRNSVGICERACDSCDLLQDADELIEAYEMAEYALQRLTEAGAEWKTRS